MRIDCSPAVLRALAMATRAPGEKGLTQALLAALLHDPEGAAAVSAMRAGLILEKWESGISFPPVSEAIGLKIRDFPGELQGIVRHAGHLFREAFQEGELTSPYLLLAVLRVQPRLAGEMSSHGLSRDRLEQELIPAAQGAILVPGIDLNDPAPGAATPAAALRLARERLYFLATAQACSLGLERTVREAIAGGVGVVQSREKGLADRAWLSVLESLRRWTEEAGALLIVNDRPDLAAVCGADGVHLGQEDMGVRQARGILGEGRLVGTSTHNLDQWGNAVRDGADYAGVGPVFQSRTKEFSGLSGLDYVGEVSRTNEIIWFALGGIDPGNTSLAARAGARRVAVSGCLANSTDPRGVAKQIMAALDKLNP